MIKKIITFGRKHDTITVGIILLTMIVGFSFDVYLVNTDELWNFQNICK